MLNAPNLESLTITPITSRRCLDRVYMDLMDFTSQPDGEYTWVLQLKDHFSRMIWLFPLKNKESLEVANALKIFLTWCGHPTRFYSDNGTEFKGDVDDLLAARIPPIAQSIGSHFTYKHKVHSSPILLLVVLFLIPGTCI